VDCLVDCFWVVLSVAVYAVVVTVAANVGSTAASVDATTVDVIGATAAAAASSLKANGDIRFT